MENLASAFAHNLRTARKKKGMTQSQLGTLISYSEKSVSKWESASAIPPAEVLVQLSELLQCSIDDLFASKAPPEYYLGIDGGGTKTDFALTDRSGKLLRREKLDACNPVDIGDERCIELLDSGIRKVCEGIPFRKISVYAGISGGIYGSTYDAIGDCLAGYHFAAYGHGGDSDSTLAAGLGEKNGIAVIMGTGSIAYAVQDKVRHRVGGYGYLFDSSCNGFSFGQAAIQCALAMRDGRKETSILAEMTEKQLGGIVSEFIPMFYEKGKRFIASFSKCVFDAYLAGDKTAAELLENSANETAKYICAAAVHIRTFPTPVVFTGGLTAQADILLPLIEKKLDRPERFMLTVCKSSPVIGALMLAGAPAQQGATLDTAGLS